MHMGMDPFRLLSKRLIVGNTAGRCDGDHSASALSASNRAWMSDHIGRETVDQKDDNHMRSFFVATMASFAVTATLCAISAVTVWLWHP
jgi:hypothetical protein